MTEPTTTITAAEILHPGNYLGHAFLAAMGSGPEAGRVAAAFQGGAPVEITFTVAGVVLDARPFFQRFQEDMEASIASAAQGLVETQLGKALDEVTEMHRDLKKRSRELFGAPKEEW